ncbi:hypothetical protein Efla_003100 [Eimeria flavescens]
MMALLPTFVAIQGFLCAILVDSADYIVGGRKRTAAALVNGGPQCRRDAQTVLEGQCSFVCESIWEEKGIDFLACYDPMSCFQHYWNENLRQQPQIQSGLVSTLLTECYFDTRPRYAPVAQYDAVEEYGDRELDLSAFVGGRLCEDLELEIVDFVAGHPSAFKGDDWNCYLYSAAAEAQAACDEDKQANNEIYCKLSKANMPTIPPLSDLCLSPPSPEYRYAFFFSCVPPRNSSFECMVSSTSSWDTTSASCKCPTGTSSCTVQEARISDAWRDQLPPAAQVYLDGSIRFLARYDVYEAFKYSYNPCRSTSARALCKRFLVTVRHCMLFSCLSGDMGPHCFKGNDQPFCRMPCLELWREFLAENDPHNSYLRFERFWNNYDFSQHASIDSRAVNRVKACTFGHASAQGVWLLSEYERIVSFPEDDLLSLDNNCAPYERWSLVKVIFGRREAIVDGLAIDRCTEVDLTEKVHAMVPESFQTGDTRNYGVHIKEVHTVSEGCLGGDLVLFLAWNCSPDTSIVEDALPVACNVYKATAGLQDSQHSCACPNSARPCGANAAAVSRAWLNNSPPSATVSLADFLVYKTNQSGFGNLVVTDDFERLCANEDKSYVLCEGKKSSWAISSILCKAWPDCKRAFSTKSKATSADDRACRTACDDRLSGDCADASNPWVCVSNFLITCYVPNTDSLACHIELPGPEDKISGTCACITSTLGACTAFEAMATAHLWESSLPDFVGEEGGVIIAKNNRAMWPTSPPSWHYEAGPQHGKCERRDWIKGIFCLGGEGALLKGAMRTPQSCVLFSADAHAPECSSASSTNPLRVSDFQCRYLCGTIEWRCREIMAVDPNTYNDLIDCFEQLKGDILMDFCQVGRTANLAASWLLASGSEAEVRFPNALNPTPVVFIGASRSIEGLPKFAISHVTSESFKVQLFGGFCGVQAVPASAELKLAASYMAIPPGEYLAKNFPLRVIVGHTIVTSSGEVEVRFASSLSDPSKAVVLLEPQSATGHSPQVITATALLTVTDLAAERLKFRVSCVEPFTTISVGYLIAELPDEGTVESSLAASLGGRYLALLDPAHVDRAGIALPANLPSSFTPHFFPQIHGLRLGRKTVYSLQWQERAGQSWTPSVLASKCGSAPEALRRLSSSDVKLRGLYVAASKGNIWGGTKTDEECARLCSGIHLLYCANSTGPLGCLQALLPHDFTSDCILLTSQENASEVKCRVLDMRSYSSSLAWDSPTFTCACPGHSSACSQGAAEGDLTWLKQLNKEGGLCETAGEAIKPVIQQYFQLNQDACSLGYLQDPSLLTWSKRAYPAYPDLMGVGSESAADEEYDAEVPLPQASHVPPSCFPGEWGPWSACDATCLAADHIPLRRRTRSPLVTDELVQNTGCVLEEKEGCGNTLLPCSAYCWTAPWTDWADCTDVLAEGTLVNARRRYKPIFAGFEYCDPRETQEYDICHAGESRDIDNAEGSGGFAEVLSVQQDQNEVSEWSGCDVPCLLAKGHQALKRKLGRAAGSDALSAITQGANAPVPCEEGVDSKDCDSSFDINCSDVVPTYQSPDGYTSCKQKCEKARLKCMTLALVDALAKPVKSCLMAQFSSVEFYSTCRFSGKQRIYDHEGLPAVGGTGVSAPSCACLEHGLEPCTPEDIVEDWKGIRDALLGSGGLCSTEAAQTPLWITDKESRRPDSSIFFGYAGLGRLHCPLRGYKKSLSGVEEFFTFTNFSTVEDLNTFCEKGLSYWEDVANPLVYSDIPDCSKAIARETAGVPRSAEATDACQKLCSALKESCTVGTSSATYEECFVKPFQSSAFADACTFAPVKVRSSFDCFSEKEPKCGFTPWSDWSACSVSCISSIDRIASSFRIRSREVVEEGKKSAHCRDLSLFGTVEVDACPDTALCDPYAAGGAPQLVTYTTKAPPSVVLWSPEKVPESSAAPDPNVVPDGVNPQQCQITRVDIFGNKGEYDELLESCSCPSGYRPCYRGEAILSSNSWAEDAYRICSSASNISVRARNFQEFSCVSRGFVLTTAINEHSSHEEKTAFCGTVQYMFCTAELATSNADLKTLFFMAALCLGAVAGMTLAYLSLQYSVDLQKLVGLRGRYADISVELEKMKEKTTAKD